MEDDAEEADDGGIWKGRYHLRGHQVGAAVRCRGGVGSGVGQGWGGVGARAGSVCTVIAFPQSASLQSVCSHMGPGCVHMCCCARYSRHGTAHTRAQVNQLRGPPPKRPRYSEGPSGGGGRRRPDHDDDDDEEEGSSEEEEEDDEEEEAGGKAAGRQERDRGRDRSRKRDRKGGGGPAARVRYTLRDRSRMVPMSVQEQQRQKEELQREMMWVLRGVRGGGWRAWAQGSGRGVAAWGCYSRC